MANRKKEVLKRIIYGQTLSCRAASYIQLSISSEMGIVVVSCTKEQWQD